MLKKVFLCFSLLAAAGLVHAKDGDEGKAVINGKISSILATQHGKAEISGRVSAFLRMAPEDVDRGRVRVGAFNVLYTGVPQALISGRKSEIYETGNLGFAINVPEEGQYLEYDPQKLTLTGTISGSTSISQFDEIHQPKDDGRGHDFDALTQGAKLRVQIFLDKPLDASIGSDKPMQFRGSMDMDMEVDAQGDYDIGGYRLINPNPQLIDLEIAWVIRLEVAKRLCLQPVRVSYFTYGGGWPPIFTAHYSGDGLAFGLPGAQTEWGKADVVFSVREWKTVFNVNYSTLTSGEATALRATVDDDDCAEVFFVDQLSPNSMWGGGATWGGGTASAKIISSDENADHGIDATHLAHEIGHVITLKHPGEGFPNASAPNRVDGSTGTLMCPSGFMNDNPQVNSQWNKDSVQNPLFTFAIKVVGPSVDCQNDADCGACP